MHKTTIIILTVLGGVFMGQISSGDRGGMLSSRTAEAEKCLRRYEHEIVPLEIKVNRAWWDANISGKPADFEKKEALENELDKMLSDSRAFADVKQARAKLSDSDPALLRRQMEVLYLEYLEKQVPPALLKEISRKSNQVEQKFNLFRAKVAGKELTDSAVRKILKESTDGKARHEVWTASKEVGAAVESDLKQLVELRNRAARALGHPNYHTLQLFLAEQSPAEVLKLFDELDTLTKPPFEKLKAEIDGKLAKRYGIAAGELRPWHYEDPFFQESPSVFNVDLDGPYAKVDILKLCREFYAGLGLPIDDVIARSDLYEKPGKSPHAFCTDIDRAGDVRVLANNVPNEYWMSTMLHELGHSVYSSKFIPKELPYGLRTDAHILVTEGVAMLFQKFSKSAAWLQKMGVSLSDAKAYAEAGALQRRSELLIFSRWCQVMFRFEKALYENPSQDLGALWWTLVERYQGLKKPEGRNAPDYAAKIHIVTSPAYYHNYLMGELFAAQVHHTVAREILKAVSPAQADYVGRKEVGEYFVKRVFGPGRSLSWNELTRFATGEPLNAKAFAEDLN